METELEIERLPVDLLAHIFSFILSFKDLAQASGVCWKWRRGVKESLSRKERLSFAGWKVDDESAARVVRAAYNIKELDMYLLLFSFFPLLAKALPFVVSYEILVLENADFFVLKLINLKLINNEVEEIRSRSRSCWGCQITDEGLYKISLTKCVGNLLSISMWGMAGITDRGVIQLVVLYYAYCNMALAMSINFSKFKLTLNHLSCDIWHSCMLNELVEKAIKTCTIYFVRRVTQANSLQHLNVGGTFITDESLYAIANSCPQIKTIILWSCRHVTENGLKKLVDKCCKLKSINVWDMKVPVDCFLRLLAINPTLELKPLTQHLGVGRIWPAS
ncbi:hypothetical protein ZIOFF_057970 [Zingiber officinale]|uniref:F-box domain-containing protein n=1 Tax=Zingiber officinale TaxID=94328 RepID=A0A8J5FA14_ZINOF|nr:hypothetical protein ZIOFF_057970 [Zingiber officinale]